MYAVLREAWLHNQHRGHDASGYFRIDATNKKPYVKKAPREAQEILGDHKDEDKLLSPAVVFAAHTRAATLGEATNPLNNHPIEYQQMLVTHNGTISNHNKFRLKVPTDLKDTIGEVDSTAIAIALNELEGPAPVRPIVDVLRELEGGMAIHAVWKNHPGVSLLARGKNSPLFVRWNEDLQVVVYASVEEATWSIIDAMGLDPNADGWEIRRLDEFSLLVVNDGKIDGWALWKPKGWSPTGNKAMQFMSRLFKGKPVFKTDMKDFWGHVESDLSLSAARGAKQAKLIYTRKKGFLKAHEGNRPPFSNESWALGRLMEAHQIWEHEKKPYYYALFGNGLEVIVNKRNNELLDVYDDVTYPDMDRWLREEKPELRPVSEGPLTFAEWMIRGTTAVHAPTTVAQEYEFERRKRVQVLPVHVNPTQGEVRTMSRSFDSPRDTGLPIEQQSLGLRHAAGTIREMFGNEDEWLQMLEPITIDVGLDYTWDNFDEDIVTHQSKPMAFLENLECSEHKVPYVTHDDPEMCELAVLASIAAASTFRDVTMWWALTDSEVEVKTRHAKDENGVSQPMCKGGEGGSCMWYPYLWRRVFIGHGEHGERHVMELLMGERCAGCDARMFVSKLPDYMEAWTGDKDYVDG